jgi:hypothetical protein
MFYEIEYKLLIKDYMTKDEYKELVKGYMKKYNISYTSAVRIIHDTQLKKFEEENDIKYYKALIDTYNDIVENGYNISLI